MFKLDETKIPVLVGCSRYTQKCDDPRNALNPLDMCIKACEEAGKDTTIPNYHTDILAKANVVGSINLGPIGIPSFLKGGTDKYQKLYTNPPKSISNHFSNTTDPKCLSILASGHAPQYMINQCADMIGNGEIEIALLCGCEFLDTLANIAKHQLDFVSDLNWGDTPLDEEGNLDKPIYFAPNLKIPPQENIHGLSVPVRSYPLFEQAMRKRKGLTIDEHFKNISNMWSGMSKVAANNPQHAWFPTYKSPEDILNPNSNGNRYVGYPYTKYHCSFLGVDQGAALILMSLAKAKELKIPQEKYVYLHGGAEAYERDILKRPDLSKSEAMRVVGEQALAQANINIEQVEHFDIYSCFPCAVNIMTESLGVPEHIRQDGSRLTTTGGIPFHGGAGANYTMHGVVSMMERLRDKSGDYGIVTANGGFLSKHAIGIYSTNQPSNVWRRPDHTIIENLMAALPVEPVATNPDNVAGQIETYTVVHNSASSGPSRGIIIGKLVGTNERYVAVTNDKEVMNVIMNNDVLDWVVDLHTSGARKKKNAAQITTFDHIRRGGGGSSSSSKL